MSTTTRKKTVVFDFDGVLTRYSGWKGEEVADDPPVAGMREAMADLERDYRIIIVSSRSATPQGREAVRGWLKRNGFPDYELMADKPPAVCYVDDRAVCFDGDPAGLPQKVRSFQTWQQKEQERKDRKGRGVDVADIAEAFLTEMEDEDGPIWFVFARLQDGRTRGLHKSRDKAEAERALESLRRAMDLAKPPDSHSEPPKSRECWFRYGGRSVNLGDVTDAWIREEGAADPDGAPTWELVLRHGDGREEILETCDNRSAAKVGLDALNARLEWLHFQSCQNRAMDGPWVRYWNRLVALNDMQEAYLTESADGTFWTLTATFWDGRRRDLARYPDRGEALEELDRLRDRLNGLHFQSTQGGGEHA